MNFRLSAAALLIALTGIACSTKKESGGDFPPSDFMISPASVNLSYGQEATLTTVYDGNPGIMLWMTSPEDQNIIQIIDQQNLGGGQFTATIKAIGENGQAVVHATPLSDLSKRSTSCHITVSTIPVRTLELGISQVGLEIEGTQKTYQVQPVITPDNATNKTLEYASADPSVATVSRDGLISAVNNGETTVTVSTTDGSGLERTIIVKVVDKVEKLLAFGILTEGDKNILPDMQVADILSCQLFWFPPNVTEKNYTVTITPSDLATVIEQNEDGFLLRALKAGSGTVKLKAATGYTTSDYTLNIQAGSPKLEWDWSGLEEYITQSINPKLLLSYDESPRPTLKATVFNSSDTRIAWSTRTEDLLSGNGAGQYWPKQNSYADGGNIRAALASDPDVLIEYGVICFMKPEKVHCDQPDNLTLGASPIKLTFTMSSSQAEKTREIRQRVRFTLSNSIAPYVSMVRDVDDSSPFIQDKYILSRKQAPDSPVSGTITVWALGYSSVSKTLHVSVQ